jgi:hypothetical protein
LHAPFCRIVIVRSSGPPIPSCNRFGAAPLFCWSPLHREIAMLDKTQPKVLYTAQVHTDGIPIALNMI